MDEIYEQLLADYHQGLTGPRWHSRALELIEALRKANKHLALALDAEHTRYVDLAAVITEAHTAIEADSLQ